jgi:hypothetical protein
VRPGAPGRIGVSAGRDASCADQMGSSRRGVALGGADPAAEAKAGVSRAMPVVDRPICPASLGGRRTSRDPEGTGAGAPDCEAGLSCLQRSSVDEMGSFRASTGGPGRSDRPRVETKPSGASGFGRGQGLIVRDWMPGSHGRRWLGSRTVGRIVSGPGAGCATLMIDRASPPSPVKRRIAGRIRGGRLMLPLP